MSRVFQREGMWWVDFQDAQGIRRRKKIGPDKRIATEVLHDFLSKVARRVHLGVIDDSKISFSEFCDIWQRRTFPRLSETEKTRWAGIVKNHLKPTFRGSLGSVTLDQVEEYQTKRIEDGVTTGTVNKELTVLKHILKRASKWEYLGANPIAGVKKFKEPNGRNRYLTLDEIDRLVIACAITGFKKPKGHFFSELVRAYLKPLVVVALNTGMRQGELLALTRKDIDWTNRIATLKTSKNGEPRYVHLNAAALSALKALPARLDTDRLFPFRGDQVTMAFGRAVRRAGISDFRFHDLRHTFCSYHAMGGVQARGLQVLMGHKDARMTARYSHLSDVYLREAVNQVMLGLETTNAVASQGA